MFNYVCKLCLADGVNVLGELNHLVGEAPLIVVPCHELNEVVVQSKTGLSIEDGGPLRGEMAIFHHFSAQMKIRVLTFYLTFLWLLFCSLSYQKYDKLPTKINSILIKSQYIKTSFIIVKHNRTSLIIFIHLLKFFNKIFHLINDFRRSQYLC